MRKFSRAYVSPWLATALVALASACGESDEDDHASTTFPGCEEERFEACDVFASTCQNAIFSTMACLRGVPTATKPPVRSITPDEYRAELLDAEDPTDADTMAILEDALVLLDLATEGSYSTADWVDLYVETVPAYYSGVDDRVTLIEADTPSAPGTLTLTLGHEYVHALQDQQVDLVELWKSAETTDASFAQDGVVEGEAELLESFLAATMWGLAPDGVDLRTYFMSWVDWAEEEYADESPLLASPRYFPYSYGARYAFNVYEAGGTAAVRALLDSPPAGTLPLIASGAGVSDLEIDPMSNVSVVTPLPSFELVLVDSLGAWLFEKFLERSAQLDAHALALTLRGDRFVVFTDGAGNVVVLWRLRFDTPESTTAALTALSRSGPGSWTGGDPFAVDRDAILVAAWDAAVRGQWIAAAMGPWDADPAALGFDGTTDAAGRSSSLIQLLRRTVPAPIASSRDRRNTIVGRR